MTVSFKHRVILIMVSSLIILFQSCSTSTKDSLTKQSNTLSAFNERDYILEKIVAGDLEEAISFTEKVKKIKLDQLREDYSSINKSYEAKEIRYELWSVGLNKIILSLYEILPEREREISYVPKSTMDKMIEENKIDELLIILIESGYDKMNLLKARLDRVKREYKKGNISSEIVNVMYARGYQSVQYYYTTN